MHIADLSHHTTFRVGGRALVATAQQEQEIIELIEKADSAKKPLMILGGGSNVLIGDGTFDGVVVRIADAPIEVTLQESSSCGGASFTVPAGCSLDDLVAYACREGWVGLEALSGIPGTVGAMPIQNVGAYGQEASDSIASVRTYDRETKQIRTFAWAECDFKYRNSIFKSTPYAPNPGPTGRYVVLAVSFQTKLGTISDPLKYADLVEYLQLEMGERAPLHKVREAVIAVRSRKGMVLNSDDNDTWSAGSFFMNPIITTDQAAQLPADAPQFAQGNDLVKTSAAWLIERSGFAKGFKLTPDAPAGLSTKHTLALTNRGAASANDIVLLAKAVREGVRKTYGIELVPEPVRVGVDL